VFDAEKGRLVRSNMATTFRGSLTLDVMGNQLEMDMMMEMNGTARVHSKNPVGN
jgi:hypothetical protein